MTNQFVSVKDGIKTNHLTVKMIIKNWLLSEKKTATNEGHLKCQNISLSYIRILSKMIGNKT